MAIIKKQVNVLKCERCGYEWIPNNKKELPVKCAKCNSPYWNKKSKKCKESAGEIQL